MISVAIHPDRQPTASEFFQLFKTEWEFYRSGEPCTILLTDGTAPPDASTELYLMFSPEPQPNDKALPDLPKLKTGGCSTRLPDGKKLPVYTNCKQFGNNDDILLSESETGQTIAYAETGSGHKTIRVGYDLFDEVAYLLTTGQPPQNANIPALDRQIDFFRALILNAGHSLIEIPPCPPGYPYMVCLTHDVDFVSIRAQGLNTTFQGFAKRALLGSVRRALNGRLTVRQVLQNFGAVLSVPLIHLGLRKDFWMQFDQYRRMEEPHRSTFFLIPFKNRPGREVSMPHHERRATRYDVTEIRQEVLAMQEKGWEFGLHGIDAWHDADSADEERNRVAAVLGTPCAGIRMHWLCWNEQTARILDEAGFEFDSTCGYNETIGFSAGTSQVFQPLNAQQLLEIPLHIQDVALFYRTSLNLDKTEAATRCETVLKHQQENGGVLTVLWHMRSIAPERLWDGLYRKLLNRFTQDRAWFGTAHETAEWFRGRRRIRLSSQIAPDGERIIRILGGHKKIHNQITIRIYHKAPYSKTSVPPFTDIVWNGKPELHTGMYEEPELEQRPTA